MGETEQQSLSISLFDTPLGKEKGQPSLNELIKKICADKNFAFLKYILQTTNFIPSEPVDEFGNTILHFIIFNLEDMGGLPFLQSFLANPNVKKIINTISKKDGFTPAIAACSLRQYKVVDLLADAGADLKIPSRDGTKIMTATETEVKQETELPKATSKEEGLVSNFLSRIWHPMSYSNKSDIIPDMTSIDMSTSVPVVPEKQVSKNLPREVQPRIGQLNELSTEAFVKGVINGTLAASASPEVPKMSTGGSHSVVVGQRFLNKAPEYSSISGGSSDRKKKKKKRVTKKKSKRSLKRSTERKSESRGSFELGRITDDIHERTIETIKSLMGVDEETAKAYKSILYYKVKEEHPEMSGYERAVEMEKLATKAVLKEIDIDAAKKIREELKSVSASNFKSSEKKPRKKKSELSDTSSSELLDTSSSELSDTSSSELLDTSSSEVSKKKPKKKPKRKPRKSESQSESTSSPELDTNLSM